MPSLSSASSYLPSPLACDHGDDMSRETWMCRSTVGSCSDAEEDDEERESKHEHETLPIARDEELNGVHGASLMERVEVSTHQQSMSKNHPPLISSKMRRRLSLGEQFKNERALKKVIVVGSRQPPVPVHAPDVKGRSAKKKALDDIIEPAARKKTSVDGKLGGKMMKKGDGDLTLYMDYDRESLTKRSAPAISYRQCSTLLAVFLSTTGVHCVTFNLSPGIREVFGTQGSPVGVCIVIASLLIGLTSFIGSCMGDFVRDRVVLLRWASVVWLLAIVALQVARLPLPISVVQVLAVCGFFAAFIAHGIILPNTTVLVSRNLSEKQPDAQPQQLGHLIDPKHRIARYLSWYSAATTIASSGVQAFYFMSVNFNLGDASSRRPRTFLSSRHAYIFTLSCNAMLAALITVFLVQTRGLQGSADGPTVSSRVPTLERKLAGELHASTTLSVRDLRRLGQRAVAVHTLVVLCSILLIGSGASMVVHVVAASTTGSRAHLAVFSLIFVGWLLTMLTVTAQLSPTCKVYAESLSMGLRPRQVKALAVLVSLAGVTAFTVFLRAQLFTTLLVQSCQLQQDERLTVELPSLLPACVGLISAIMLVALRCAMLRWRWQHGDVQTLSSTSPLRRASIGVLLYVVAVFLSSVVELYRRKRSTRSQSARVDDQSATCSKVTSDFSFLWAVPHLVLLALGDAVFRSGVSEEAHVQAEQAEWWAAGHSALSFGDIVGYAAALTMSSWLSPWLYGMPTSDLVVVFLLVTSVAALLYAVTKRLVEKSTLCTSVTPDARDSTSTAVEARAESSR
ncbi:hypothetical protein PINS_up003513 [Pythium insidiosum]|nr:hypothetical protein PINS_up003513 [Pythium insidiosum]